MLCPDMSEGTQEMSEPVWLKSYPAGVPGEIDPDHYPSVVAAFHDACDRYADKPSFRNMGVSLSYRRIQELSAQFSAFCQNELGLKKGDRIAIQMPNVLQYPVALFGALRAGLIVVNTNPLYTPREMSHQFRDSEIKAIVILSNFAHKLQQILPELDSPHIVVTDLGDLFPTPKRMFVNAAVRYLKKMVPAYHLPNSISFRDALAQGQRNLVPDVEVSQEDLAFLQYTGGTTGVAKGAMLTHRNVVANVQQAFAWMAPRFTQGEEVAITPLPLYHIFSLTVNCLVFMLYGAQNELVTNPRDFPAFIKLLQKRPFTVMTAVNTLLNALMKQPGFERIDFSQLKLTVAGAMALQKPVAERWQSLTGTPVVEGYGLTEASPIVCCNPVDGTERVGTIGLPFPSTRVRFVDEEGNDVPEGTPGELIVSGPQVMQGYWNQPEENKHVLRDGWLFTGDVAQIDEDGFIQIVDRKKDMILVSGFNVYPNEVEEEAVSHPKVAEAGAVGIADENSGEVVKLVVVKSDPSLTEQELIEHLRKGLTSYKVPKLVEFRDELPKTPVGKVLRRALR